MTSIYAALIPFTFIFFPNGNMIGTTTDGIPFSQTTISESPRIQEFKIGPEHWFICEGGVMETLKDISICLSNN